MVSTRATHLHEPVQRVNIDIHWTFTPHLNDDDNVDDDDHDDDHDDDLTLKADGGKFPYFRKFQVGAILQFGQILLSLLFMIHDDDDDDDDDDDSWFMMMDDDDDPI